MLLVLSPWATAAPAQPVQPAVGQEAPATATDLRAPPAHNSPLLVDDPATPGLVALAHRQDAPEFGCGLALSGDRGRSWVPARPVPTLPDGAERCYAPEVVVDRRGRLYYLFLGLAGPGNRPTGAYLVTSTDRGRTFSAPRAVLGPGNYQVRMTIDPAPGSQGRLHLVWLHAEGNASPGGLAPGPNPILTAASDDGGRTFTEPVQVSDGDRPRSVAPAIVVTPDHTVHVAYYDLQDDARDYQGLAGPRWDGRWSVVVASSADGGRSFGRGVVVDNQLAPPGRVVLIHTMPPPALAVDGRGRVLVAWTDARHGDADVFLSTSADGGRTFPPPRRLNDDPAGNGRDQYLPRVAVAPTGRVDVVFLDRREDPGNIRNHLFFTSSGDGGLTFAPNLRVTSHSSDTRVGQRYAVPSAAGLYEIGSRLGLLSRATSVVVAWPDMRNSAVGTTQQDVFTAVLRFPGGAGAAPGRGPLLPAIAAATLVGAALAALVVAKRSR